MQKQQLSRLQQLATDLQVKAELNDPEVQWRFRTGMRDMNRPVYRYMAQREFQKDHKSKLIERVTQMRVCPDVLEQFDPAAQVIVQYGDNRVQEAGIFLQPGEVSPSRIKQCICSATHCSLIILNSLFNLQLSLL
jgi:large subunit ribosomal protein L35